MLNITPKEIVNKLDEYIIGQKKAKRLVAIALRNRWRRINVNKNIRQEINPRNILMIGSTGVGKTEIARRLAKISDSPFIKVEATKFTEVGYVGKEVESIIKDLADISYNIIKNKYIKKYKYIAKKIAEDKILNIVLENKKKLGLIVNNYNDEINIKNIIKNELLKGKLDNEEIEININNPSIFGVEIISNSESDDINNKLQSIIQNISNKKNKLYKTKIKFARKIIVENEYNKFINIEEIKEKSVKLTEQSGIVFIDEIDKICKKNYDSNNIDVSREGVQRDLLPIVEGCSVSTKYGNIKTDYILFIASGSFKSSKISNLIPELQGRFPIKVKLDDLDINDYKKILTAKKISLIDQHIALLKTEGIELKFTECGINKISEISWLMNEKIENIGARRLNTVIEEIMEDISFIDFKNNKKEILINKEYVNKYFKNIVYDDLDKFIL